MTKNKIIFLDIDGVLNSVSSALLEKNDIPKSDMDDIFKFVEYLNYKRSK